MTDNQNNDSVRKEDMESRVKAEVGRQLQDIVSVEVAKAEDKRFRNLRIFAFIGLAGLFSICKFVIDNTLDYKLDQRVGQMTASLDVIRIYNMAAKLDYKIGIPPEDISEIMRFLRQKENDTRVRNDKDFSLSLFKILYNFSSKDMTAQIDEIFKRYEKEILTSPELVETLLHHYGQAITARGSTPVYADDILLKNFLKLDNAGRKQCPHVSLYYRLLFTFKEYDKSDVKIPKHVNELIGESKSLDLEGKAWFIYNLLLRTRPANWQDNPNQIGRAIQPVAVSLLQKFGGKLEAALGTDKYLFSTFLKDNPPVAKTEEDKEREKKAKKDKAKAAVDLFLINMNKQGEKIPQALQGGFQPY